MNSVTIGVNLRQNVDVVLEELFENLLEGQGVRSSSDLTKSKGKFFITGVGYGNSYEISKEKYDIIQSLILLKNHYK